MNHTDYREEILHFLDSIKIEGLKRFNPIKSILTHNSKEVSVLNNRIIIEPIDECIAITIRGLYQSVDMLSKQELTWLEEDFRYYISNNKKENGEMYEEFIKRRLNCISDHNPHIHCLYLESNNGEIEEFSKIEVTLSTYPYNDFIYLVPSQTRLIETCYYKSFKCNMYDYGIMLKLNESIKNTLEIKVSKSKIPLEIKKFRLYLECDRWYKRNKRNNYVF